MSEKKLNALIQLLDDPDREVYDHVFAELKSYGKSIIPELEGVWENSFDSELQNRVELLIHKIQFEELKTQLKHWADNESEDLLKGTLIVSRYQFPELDEESFYHELHRIEQSIWLELNQFLTAFEQIHVFNKIFYENYGFGGSPTQIKDPNAFFINKVLESKKGTPLSLGTIYMILANRLHLPVFGVNLPKHFILAYCNDDDIASWSMMNNPGNVMFYINPLNKGTVFKANEIKEYLKKLNLPVNDAYFLPCSNIEIVKQFFTELQFIFRESGNPAKVAEMEELIEVL